MSLYVGLDVGGTKLLVASANRDGEVLRRTREDTPLDLAEGIDALHRMIAVVIGDEAPAAIGAAVGGPLDRERGIVSPLHQPRWRDVALREIFEERWGCPLLVEVDTDAAALGEHRFGGGTASRLLYVTLSTGIGGGFLVDGEVYRGAGGGHPEIGHQSVPLRCSHPERVACECGAPDCLEALASGNGIRRVYGKPAEELGEGEWREVAWHLGQGLRNLAAIYLPDEVVLGGGVAMGGGEALVDAATEIMREHLRLVAAPTVRLSRLGSETALMGAIALALRGA